VKQFKLGRKPRGHDARIPRMSTLQRGQPLTPPPPSVDWTAKLPADTGAMLNDALGDCCCAAVYHAIQVWTANANPPMLTWPNKDVRLLYERACGYVPGNSSTDQGCVEQDVLAYLLKSGAPTGKWGGWPSFLSAYVEIDVQDTDNVKRAIADCAICYIGMNIPAYIMATEPPPEWAVDPSADNSIVGGHAVVLAGYDGSAATFISWGSIYRMTWAFFLKFVDEAYALVDKDFIEATGKTPIGMNLAALEAAMQELKKAT
jgi:hypothetical protein